MDNEKKFKLDELPDKGSEPDKIVFTPLRKNIPEPRLVNLKKLNDAERAEALAQTWTFDKRKMNWGWLFWLIVIIGLQRSKILLNYQTNEFLMAFDSELTFFIHNPMVFAILIPFVFKFTSSNEDHFELNFNGIKTIESLNVTPFVAPTRVKMDWNDIKGVKKMTVRRREVLELHNALGPFAQLIWDIDDLKKNVVKQVLRNLVAVNHPMLIFIEKEVA